MNPAPDPAQKEQVCTGTPPMIAQIHKHACEHYKTSWTFPSLRSSFAFLDVREALVVARGTEKIELELGHIHLVLQYSRHPFTYHFFMRPYVCILVSDIASLTHMCSKSQFLCMTLLLQTCNFEDVEASGSNCPQQTSICCHPS